MHLNIVKACVVWVKVNDAYCYVLTASFSSKSIFLSRKIYTIAIPLYRCRKETMILENKFTGSSTHNWNRHSNLGLLTLTCREKVASAATKLCPSPGAEHEPESKLASNLPLQALFGAHKCLLWLPSVIDCDLKVSTKPVLAQLVFGQNVLGKHPKSRPGCFITYEYISKPLDWGVESHFLFY